MSRHERRVVVTLFVLLALVGSLTVLPRAQGWSDASRMAAVQAMVDHGTLSIDDTDFAPLTHDKVWVDGHFYSDKQATPALIGAVVYAPLSAVGIKLAPGWNPAYALVTWGTVTLWWWLGLVALYRLLGLTGLPAGRRAWLAAATGLGSLHLTWVATFNNHSLAASWLLIALAAVAHARASGGGRWLLACAGLALGLAASSDMPTGAFAVALGAVVVADPRLRTRVAWLVVPFLLAVAPALWVNHAISGSLVPLQLVPEFFLYPGSPWTREELTGSGIAAGGDLVGYAAGMLVGGRGFLLYNPLLWLAIPLLVREAFARGRTLAPEARAVAAAGAALVAYYLLLSTNYSGQSYSIRWWVPLLPVTLVFLYPWLARLTRVRLAAFGVLFVLGLGIALVGSLDPWTNTRVHPVPLVANILQLPELLAARLP